MQKKYTYSLSAFFIICSIIIIYTIITIPPEALVTKIGIQNGYILAVITTFFAGFSVITTATAYSFLIALMAGGLSPVILGISEESVLVSGICSCIHLREKEEICGQEISI